MNKLFVLIVTLLLIQMPEAVSAGTFDYTSIGARYVSSTTDISGVSEKLKGKGAGIDVSLNIVSNLVLTGSYATETFDATLLSTKYTSVETKYKFDVTQASYGAFVYFPVLNDITDPYESSRQAYNADVYAGIDILRGTEDVYINGTYNSSYTDNGHTYYVGIRSKSSSRLEVNFEYFKTTIEGNSTNNIFVGVAYYLGEELRLELGYDHSSDTDVMEAGARKYF